MTKKQKQKTQVRYYQIITVSFFLAVAIIGNAGVRCTNTQALPSPTVYVPHRAPKITITEQKPSKTLIAHVTGYSELDSCHTGQSCLMASGKRAYVGAIACPRAYKLGTRVKITDTVYTCEDRTAKRLDGRFDIFFGYGQGSYDQAIKFGKKQLTINIIN